MRDIARPDGNVTGFYGVQPSLASKWLELLKEAAPQVTRVAVLYHSELLSTQMRSAYLSVIAAAGSAHSIQVTNTPVRDPFTIVRAIDAFATEANGGLIVLPTTTVGSNRDTIFRLTEQYRLPTIYSTNRGLIEAGGLMFYGSDEADRARGAASYVDCLLRGAKVSESARAVSHKVRAGDQPQDRQRPRPHHPGNAVGDCRRGDSVRGYLPAGEAKLQWFSGRPGQLVGEHRIDPPARGR